MKIAALGDPTRRCIFDILAKNPSSVAEIANQLPVTRPAVSQHLRVLKEAGLVAHRTAGTRHIYHLDAAGIANLRDYLDRLWHKALDDFKIVAESSFPESEDKKS